MPDAVNPILKLLAVHIENSPHSQEEIAKGAGVSKAVVSKIRHGKTKDARNRTIRQLMGYFGIDPRTLTVSEPGETSPAAAAWPPAIAHPIAPDFFVGRTSERMEIARRIQDPCGVLWVTGIGGVGKSSVVWAWVMSDIVRTTRPGLPAPLETSPDILFDEIIWWNFERDCDWDHFRAYALAALSRRFPDAAKVLGAMGPDDRLLRLLLEHRCLIVWDGFDEVLRKRNEAAIARPRKSPEAARGTPTEQSNDDQAFDGLITAMATQSTSRMIVIGSYLPTSLRAPSKVDKLTIEGLPADDAKDLIEFCMSHREPVIADTDRVLAETEALENVIDRYDGNPLALIQVCEDLRLHLCGGGGFTDAKDYKTVKRLTVGERHVLGDTPISGDSHALALCLASLQSEKTSPHIFPLEDIRTAAQNKEVMEMDVSDRILTTLIQELIGAGFLHRVSQEYLMPSIVFEHYLHHQGEDE